MEEFEGLVNSGFKVSQDGRLLFFPWGVLSRGYVVPSEDDYWRLQRLITACMVVTTAVILVPTFFGAYAVAAVLVVAVLVLYYVWTRLALRHFEVVDERLSFHEIMTPVAHALGPVKLWLSVIGSLVFVLVGTLLFILTPGDWLFPLGIIGFFGLGGVAAIYMLILRYRTAETEA
ncbi:hypothetical protein JQ604_16145 [Bradyrhizobium jicamae]|uniref:hypothetical protein n=1 Tax=Bradyrhizobium jicamae TaxID=280332 RepID=UPI001BAAD991|nr:hypothetical protein [Bradyrhizobium jicamae]MBR0753720.1 hypothetical protein [Bradyrhizobium jicamae]